MQEKLKRQERFEETLLPLEPWAPHHFFLQRPRYQGHELMQHSPLEAFQAVRPAEWLKRIKVPHPPHGGLI
jgi:hypothetical protein